MENLFRFSFMPDLPHIGSNGSPAIINVASFEGSEAISELYEYNITLCVENVQDIGAFINKLLRNRVTLTIQNGLLPRDICGIIRTASFKGEYQNRVFIEVVLVPQISLLDDNRKCRVFLKLSIPQIISNVLVEETRSLGLVSMNMDSIDMSKYPTEEMVCQYNESSWSFVCRLMEKVGIYYYFHQPESIGIPVPGVTKVETFVLSDNKAQHKAITTQFIKLGAMGSKDKDCLYDLNVSFSRTTASSAIRGFDLDKNRTQDSRPNAKENVVLEDSSNDILKETNRGALDIFDSSISDAEAQLFAKLGAERDAMRAEVAKAKTTSAFMEAGLRFKIIGSEFAARHQWLLTRVKHVGRQSSYLLAGLSNENESESFYYNEILAIPANVQFRSELKTAIPQINGVIPAIIEGQGENNNPCMDELGRYKVKFSFDNEKKGSGLSSCWIKLMTPYGGTDGKSGFHFPLLGGAQVLVGFVGGNIDRPYIVGTLPDANGQVTNSKFINCNVIRSPSGNVIVMGDNYDGGEFLLIKNSNGYRTLGEVPSDVLNNF